jgi:hypothetical protein
MAEEFTGVSGTIASRYDGESSHIVKIQIILCEQTVDGAGQLDSGCRGISAGA